MIKKLGSEDKKDNDLEKSNMGKKRPYTPLICRICLCDDEVLTDNPLVSVCKCSGTMSMIHIKCINEWLNSKRETRVSLTTQSYQWTILECELC